MSRNTPTMHEHTPIPWIANENHSNPLARVRIESKNEHGIVNDGYIIAQFEGPDAEANAEFVVLAANAHDALVVACEELFLRVIMHYANHQEVCKLGPECPGKKALQLAEVALALGEGE